MADGASRPFGFPREPLRSHLAVGLCRFGTEVVLFTASAVPARRHVLHERPEVKGIGIVANNGLAQPTGVTVIALTDLSDSFLVIAVKNDRRSTDDVIFDEMMKVFILLVEQRKVRLRW